MKHKEIQFEFFVVLCGSLTLLKSYLSSTPFVVRSKMKEQKKKKKIDKKGNLRDNPSFLVKRRNFLISQKEKEG